MSSIGPLSWPALAGWSHFTGFEPDAAECDALFLLDGILLSPGEMKEGAE